MRFLLRLFLLGILATLLAAAYAGWYVLRPIPLAALPVEFDVPAGASLRSAAQLLEQVGVPVGARRFELLARALGRTQGIQAGSYELTERVTPLELLDKLTSGDVSQAQVRLVEGWNIRQVRAALDRHPDLKHDSGSLVDTELLGALRVTTSPVATSPVTPGLVASGLSASGHPEGWFFPDTYLFPKGASDLSVLRRAHRAMQQRLDKEWQARDPGIPYRDPYEALIMASLIEKETGAAAERGLVSGVLNNRLRIGMRLQVDPTVIYGLGAQFDGNLKKAHLLADGPYNTYTRVGLPPTPIAMPGLDSIRAAMRPAKTDSLYYVGRGDGSTSFSRNLEEHNRAVSKYQSVAKPKRQAKKDRKERGKAERK